jgi:hypothetical protein
MHGKPHEATFANRGGVQLQIGLFDQLTVADEPDPAGALAHQGASVGQKPQGPRRDQPLDPGLGAEILRRPNEAGLHVLRDLSDFRTVLTKAQATGKKKHDYQRNCVAHCKPPGEDAFLKRYSRVAAGSNRIRGDAARPALGSAPSAPRPPKRNEVEWLSLDTEDLPDRGVVKGANRYGAEADSRGLEKDVLRGVTGIHVDVALSTALAVASLGNREIRGNHQNGGSASNGGLVERRSLQPPSEITLFDELKAMGRREIAIYPGLDSLHLTGNQVGCDRIEAPGGGGGPGGPRDAVNRHAGCRPQEPTNFARRHGYVIKATHRPSRLNGLRDGAVALLRRRRKRDLLGRRARRSR